MSEDFESMISAETAKARSASQARADYTAIHEQAVAEWTSRTRNALAEFVRIAESERIPLDAYRTQRVKQGFLKDRQQVIEEPAWLIFGDPSNVLTNKYVFPDRSVMSVDGGERTPFAELRVGSEIEGFIRGLASRIARHRAEPRISSL